MKPNQKLKYLNNGSCHTNSCFKAIPWGVFGRLANLTSRTRKNLKCKIDELYPDHYEALKDAELAPSDPPTMKEVLKLVEKSKELKNAKKRPRKSKTRQTYFCVGISDTFKGKNAIRIIL